MRIRWRQASTQEITCRRASSWPWKRKWHGERKTRFELVNRTETRRAWNRSRSRPPDWLLGNPLHTSASRKGILTTPSVSRLRSRATGGWAASWRPDIRQCLCGIGLTLFLLTVSLATYHSRSASERAFAAQRMKDFGGSEEQIRQVQNDNSPREGIAPRRFCAGVDADRRGGISGPSGRGIATRAARRNSYRA